ncbi:Nicotinamidase-related amidase [Quadrisphaera granulorum]|uniref:Nicotinamidase-related amidase n=1 Tax=Quadrisphaera granulorum TaxID=317664 RepID=A0A316A9E5_9ACTN|nr:isochorismatase family cysteine hydrolase [Quadrisphaera granulorum]PWJ53620.1 nicotinamidase-related amidase [Quadrisphaera granulorum]SZE96664.1 Nicotinamidase-related amidase [Quadrisphaera granulorum]
MSAADPRLAALRGRPALVVVDVQRDFADPSRLGEYGLSAESTAELDAVVGRIGDLVERARALGVPVVWVELASDPARPWRASDWLRGTTTGEAEQPCVTGSQGAQWYRVTPTAGEVRVVKRGYSGFAGTDLAERLTAAEVGWVTVVGLTSECCVLATAQDAMQLDWPVVVPADATTAYTPELAAAALQLLAANIAVIASAEHVTALWRGLGRGESR